MKWKKDIGSNRIYFRSNKVKTRKRIRAAMAERLGIGLTIGDDPAVIATLHALLTNRDLTGYYRPAILTLRKQGPNRQGVMPALIASLAYDKEYRALSVFVEWGPQAAAAVLAIIDILRTSDDPMVISGALFALKQIGTNEALKGHRQYANRLQAS